MFNTAAAAACRNAACYNRTSSITLVDRRAAITTHDLLPDGVHPNQAGMEKIVAVWFKALPNSR